MGMYTEYHLRFELVNNPNVREFFQSWLTWDVGGYGIEVPDTEEFKHEFFQCERWMWLPYSSSFYFPQGGKSGSYTPWGIDDHFDVTLTGSIKNYDFEIEKFIDWVKPYVYGHGFMGYHLYEEDTEPTLVYKD